MKFPNFKMNKWFTARAFVLLAGLFLMALTVPAQKTEAGANPGLEQCRNGGAASPVQCKDSAWVTGNANQQQSHYAETQFLPYRFTLRGATIGNQYMVTIGYDIIKNGAHAIDYLGTYNNTEFNADPCGDINACVAPVRTIGIPTDTSGALNSAFLGGDVPMPAGVFTSWGATFDATPAYNTYTAGDTHRNITLTFTATATDVVIAWSGHVAWAGEWGAGNSAGGISGSPYHTNIDACVGFGGCGSLDVQLSASAVLPAGIVRVIKVAQTLDGSGVANTAFDFAATPTSSFGAAGTFTIVDNVAGSGGGSKESNAITSFGAGNSIAVTEKNEFGWTAQSVTCTPNFAGTVVSTQLFLQPDANGNAARATVWVNPGGLVTCTFVNSQLQVTAAPASVTGRVLTSAGSGISGARVSIVDFSTGETRTALTNTFGYYSFTGLEVSHFYQLGVSAKKYSFQQSVKSFSLTADLADVNFVAN